MCLTRFLIVVVLGGCCIGGCAQEKRDEARPAVQRGNSRTPDERERSSTTSKPDAPAASDQPSGTTQAPPRSAEPKADEASSSTYATSRPADIPDFVLVLERFSNDKPFSIDVRVDDMQRVTLRTTNIKRLQIRRAGSGLSQTRSVAISIDQQGIEWTPKLDAVELERSINGAWRPAERK